MTLSGGAKRALAYRDEFSFGDNGALVVEEPPRSFQAPYETPETDIARMIGELVRGDEPQGVRD